MRKFLSNPFLRERKERDLDGELRFYVDTLVEEKTRAGMAPEEALRAARIQLGGIEQVKEQVRDVRPGAWLGTILQDLRYAARGLWNNPGFAVVVVLSLGIGIGANTALFSVLNAVLLRPLPVAHPDQLFALSNPLSRSSVKNIFSYPMFERMRNVAGHNEIAAMSRVATVRALVDGDPDPEPESVQLVSGEFFGLAGLSPALGRMIGPEDNRTSGGQPVAVISHDLWQRRFGGSTGVLSRGIAEWFPFHHCGCCSRRFYRDMARIPDRCLDSAGHAAGGSLLTELQFDECRQRQTVDRSGWNSLVESDCADPSECGSARHCFSAVGCGGGGANRECRSPASCFGATAVVRSDRAGILRLFAPPIYGIADCPDGYGGAGSADRVREHR